MNPRFSFDVRVTYKGGSFESFCVEQAQDRAEAVMRVMKQIRAKARRFSVSRPVETVEVFAASKNPNA